MVWFCQPVVVAISAIVAPSLRRSISSTMAFLVSVRSLVAGLAALCDFLSPDFALADFFDRAFDCLAGDVSFDLFEDFRFIGADSVVVVTSTSVLIINSPLWRLIRACTFITQVREESE